VSGVAGRGPTSIPVVTVYTRPGCHLCDEALEALERMRAATPFAIVQRDISSDDALHRAYFERIPVIELDGCELFDHFVDEAALFQALGAAGMARARAHDRAINHLESGR
jgi:glutaredoxin